MRLLAVIVVGALIVSAGIGADVITGVDGGSGDRILTPAMARRGVTTRPAPATQPAATTRPAATTQPATAPASQPVATEWASSETEPKDMPLEARLVVKQRVYKLDKKLAEFDFDAHFGEGKPGDRPRGFRNAAQLPKPPAVDLVLEIRNSGKKPIAFNVGGDSERVMLQLEGPGAVSGNRGMMMTMEYRIGKPMTLKPGQVYSRPIKDLSFGTRGISEGAWWTKPGQYTLKATYHNQAGAPMERDTKRFSVSTGAAKLAVVDPEAADAAETQPATVPADQ
jgi:hypothetical protein